MRERSLSLFGHFLPLLARALRTLALMGESGAILGTLVLVLIGVVGVTILVRRFAPQLGQRFHLAGRMQHLGLLSLTPQCSVALIRVGQETLVLGVTPHTVTLLTKTSAFEAVAEAQEGGKTRTDNDEREERAVVVSENRGVAR